MKHGAAEETPQASRDLFTGLKDEHDTLGTFDLAAVVRDLHVAPGWMSNVHVASDGHVAFDELENDDDLWLLEPESR